MLSHTQEIKPVPMGIYPTMGSLKEVIEFADTKLPEVSRNDMYSLFMTYHNTLLKVQEQERTLH